MWSENKVRRARQIVGHVFLASFCFSGVIIMAVTIVGWMMYPFGLDSPPREPDPKADFQTLTGWGLPDNANVLKAENTFSGFKGDGDYTLIVQMPEGSVRLLLQADEAGEWNECPISSEIQAHFGNFAKHSGERYRATKTRPDDADWHRGSIVVANSTDDLLWIYAWKH